MIRRYMESNPIVNDEDLNIQDYLYFGEFLKMSIKAFDFLTEEQIDDIQESIEWFLRKSLKRKTVYKQDNFKDLQQILNGMLKEKYSRHVYLYSYVWDILDSVEIYRDYVIDIDERDYYMDELLSNLYDIDKQISKDFKSMGIQLNKRKR